ncbi:beta-phosphoglucomutase [Leuconostoc citreum]|uniref:beta-phosphoglucomutase n=1 Tax=Leuconostoc citreum TaxID=33964 RepID=UPI001C1FFBBB|nr:beta-phosphoglucomutase [Leuconostoc citreum]MBU7450377.1 beta-phosphoglucomutase [Leuconostoc citreum]
MKFENIKGFAFDLDGVIADTAKFHALAWQKIAEEVGTTWTTSLAESLKGVSRMASLQIILDASNRLLALSTAAKKELADKKNQHYQQLIVTLTPKDILPGMLKFIDSAYDNGYKMAIASASKNAPLILSQLQLTDYFDGIVDPTTLKNGKPNPEIFLRSADIMSLDNTQVIGLEDATAGITAINAAGQTSLGIGNATVLSAANLIYPSTESVTLANIAHDMKNI